MVKAGSDCCKPPLKTTKEDEDEIQEVTVSLTDDKETHLDAAVTRVLSDPDGIFPHKNTPKTDFGKRKTPIDTCRHWVVTCVYWPRQAPKGSFRQLLPGSGGKKKI